jgi:hypothetical protein
MDIASLFADPNLLQLESEAMINTDNAPSKRSADATAPFTPKARENLDLAHFGALIWPTSELTLVSTRRLVANQEKSYAADSNATGS